MKILTADEMRAADRVTTDRFGISSLELMEHAGRVVTRFILRELPRCRHVVVLCGKGNNGGDGLVAARHLAEAGCAISVLVLGDPAEIHGDAKTMLERLPVAPISIKEESDFSASGCKALLEGAQLFVDAVLGTGFHPPMRGLAVAARKVLEAYPRTPVVAVDLPSGWDADSRQFFSTEAYRANAVVTFTAPKLAHVSGMLTRGPIVVASDWLPARGSRVRYRSYLGRSLQSHRGSPSLAQFQQRAIRTRPGDRRSQGQVGRSFDELGRSVAHGCGAGHRRGCTIDFAHRCCSDPGTDDRRFARGRQGRNLQPQPGTHAS